VSETQGAGLADKNSIHIIGNNAVDRSGEVVLALLMQFPLQLRVRVEMVLDRPLGPARHEDKLGDARRNRLLNGILDDRLVDDRQQLLRHRLCGGQEPCPKPRDREDGLGLDVIENSLRTLQIDISDAREGPGARALTLCCESLRDAHPS
jgi:hypothetical protein